MSENNNLKLWLISQTENGGYDTYDSAVVVAETAEQARDIHPDGSGKNVAYNRYGTWAHEAESVTVKLIGVANPFEVVNGQVVCASFNAG